MTLHWVALWMPEDNVGSWAESLLWLTTECKLQACWMEKFTVLIITACVHCQVLWNVTRGSNHCHCGCWDQAHLKVKADSFLSNAEEMRSSMIIFKQMQLMDHIKRWNISTWCAKHHGGKLECITCAASWLRHCFPETKSCNKTSD